MPQRLELPAATMRELQQEAAVMAKLRHPCVVNFLGLCSMPPCIVTGEPRFAVLCALCAVR